MTSRKIEVSSRVWRYRIGRQFCVAKADDTGEGRRIDLSMLTGWSWADIERSRWKKGGWFVGPRHVAAWLSDNISDNKERLSQ